MNYEAFLAGLIDELEKAAKEDGGEAWHPTPDEKKGKKEQDKDEEKSPVERLKEKLEKKKGKKDDEDDDKEDDDKEEEKKEASDMSVLEVAFFNGLLEELEKDAGWRDLGPARIAKMKARMGGSLKRIRGKASASLKDTGKTGTPLYSVGERGKSGGKFYEKLSGGFKARQRTQERREGPKFQGRVQAAIQGRQKPAGPSWGERIKGKISGAGRAVAGAGSALAGAAGAAKRQAVGIGGAATGAARGALSGAASGASQGRSAAMTPVQRAGARLAARPRVAPVSAADAA